MKNLVNLFLSLLIILSGLFAFALGMAIVFAECHVVALVLLLSSAVYLVGFGLYLVSECSRYADFYK